MNPEARAATEAFWQPAALVSALLSGSARDVVLHWISQKQFLDEDNRPRLLSFCTSEDADFNRLIRQVNPHLVPSIICNELLRKGIVEQHDNGCLLLRRSAYVQGRTAFAGSSAKTQTGRRIFPTEPQGQVMKGYSFPSF